MGLRQRNAAQTRELILHTALDLFLEQGFDATRMEEVAERADIGVSTLYRYFPTKDQLLTAPLALRGQMSDELRARPADEPLDLALGHALRALLATPRPDTARLYQLFTVLASAPGPQTQLREDAAKERVLLARAVAERLGRSTDDIFCDMTARMTMSLLEQIGPGSTADEPADNATAARQALARLRVLLEQLVLEPPVLPRIDA